MSDKKLKVEVTSEAFIHIHNDIEGATHYFKSRIDRRVADSDRAGLAFEIIACLIMLAFELEAKFNFVGAKIVSDWDERMSAKKKPAKIYETLAMSYREDVRPYRSVADLRAFRDTFAHGKPKALTLSETADVTEEQLRNIQKFDILSPEWAPLVTSEFLNSAYEDVSQIWDEMLEKAGIELFEASTHGFGGTRLISD